MPAYTDPRYATARDRLHLVSLPGLRKRERTELIAKFTGPLAAHVTRTSVVAFDDNFVVHRVAPSGAGR